MKKRTAIIGALVSLLPMGQPLVIGSGAVFTSAAVMLSVPEQAQAESAEFYFDRAYNKGEAGDFLGAIADYTKAIEIDPEYENAYFNRAIDKGSLGDEYGAISDFNKVITINPKNANAYASRCGAKVNIDKNKEAIEDCERALEIKKNNRDISLEKDTVYSNLCGAKLNLKKYKEGILDCDKALKLNSNDDLAYYNRAVIKSQGSNDEYGAISDFNKAIKINNRNSFYYAGRGISKENLGDMKGACADWRKASSLGKEDAAQWVRNQCD